MVGARGVMSLGGDLSFFQGKDVHVLGVEDLCLIYPPLDGSGDGRHGEDHGSNLLVQSKRELVDEGELLFDSGLQRKMLEVLQSFFLIVPLCSLFILAVCLLGEGDAILT